MDLFNLVPDLRNRLTDDVLEKLKNNLHKTTRKYRTLSYSIPKKNIMIWSYDSLNNHLWIHPGAVQFACKILHVPYLWRPKNLVERSLPHRPNPSISRHKRSLFNALLWIRQDIKKVHNIIRKAPQLICDGENSLVRLKHRLEDRHAKSMLDSLQMLRSIFIVEAMYA